MELEPRVDNYTLHYSILTLPLKIQFSAVQSHNSVLLFVTPWTPAHQTSRPSPSPRVYSSSCPLSQWCHPTIWSSIVPFSSRLQSFQHQGLFKWVSSSHQVAKVLEFHLQHQSFQYIKYYACVYVEELGKTLLSCAVKHMDRPLNINWSHSGKNKTIFFFKFYFIFKLYIMVLVLPNIKMNLPQVYMCSTSWTLLPPPSPYHPSGSLRKKS